MKKWTKKRIILTVVISLASVVVAGGAGVGIWFATRFALRKSEGHVPTEQQLQEAVKYEKVVIFGVDGAGQFIRDAKTPNIDRIFKDGSYTYEAYTQFQSDSAPNWTSMLHGVGYCKHRVHNGDSGEKPFTNEKYPSIFKTHNAVYPDAHYLSVANWPNIAFGIIETFDNMHKYSTGDDNVIVDQFIDAYDQYKPAISFLCFDDVDAAGHGQGRTQAYYDAITKADERIGQIYDYLESINDVDKTLFIVTADHGHRLEGGHGREHEDVYHTTIQVNGHLGNIKPGQMGHAVTHDIASICLYGLGLKQPDVYDGKVPYNVFNTLDK